ncbi:MAG: FecR domain-containing protein, partial [Chloroflexi bacterium]|nr:FecR domain-containing protein [Chloroflexota bacterium]
YRAETVGIADDLTGEVFVRLVESIDGLSHRDGPLLARLYALAEDLIADRQRWAEKSSTSPQDETAERRLLPQSLATAIARLTGDQRQVILLKFVEGLDDETIARTLGMSVDAVQALQQQALAAFAVAVAWCGDAQTPSSTQRHQEVLERLLEYGIQNLAHELRTPLNLIHGYAELLLSSVLGPVHPEQRDAVKIICDGAETLSHLVRNLTLLRNIPRESLTLATLSISGWVEDALDRFRGVAEQAGVRLDLDLPNDLPPVLGDLEHLKVALSQMLDNAIKFSPDGGQVSVRVWADDENWVCVSVRDQGIGIAPEHLDRLFDRFYQVDGSPTRRFGGTGIGLSVVQAIAEAHDGRVQVASEGVDEGGSTLTLMLPVRSPDAQLPSSQSLSESPPLLGRYLGRTLDEYLLPLEDGRVTLEECLSRYPGYAADLRPLMEIALEVRRAPRLSSSPAAFAVGKRWMLDALAEKKRLLAASPRPAGRPAGRVATFLGKLKRPLMPRRAISRRLSLAGTLALVVFIIGGQILRPLIGVPVPQMATLTQVGGTVEVLSSRGEPWRRVLVGEQIEAGDRIRTRPVSSATLYFFDGSSTDLEAEAEITVVRMSSQRDGSGKVIVLHQWLGQTRHSVEHLTDIASRFQVETPSAVTTVRGTEFEIVVGISGATRVTVIEGVVDVTAQETTVAVLAGEETTILHEPPLLAVFLDYTATPVLVLTLTPSLSYLVQDTPRWTQTPELIEAPVPEAPQVNTPRPTATSVPSGGGAEPTGVPQPTTAPPPTAVPTLRPTPTPSRPTPTPIPTDTPTLVPTATPIPTDTPTPTATLEPTTVPTATLTPTPTGTPTLVPTATLTPTLTYTLEPAVTLTETPES